ncbi:MAG: carbohydrate binding domain-containing protein, partial [Candidatus Thorarchaeota archaeon]
ISGFGIVGYGAVDVTQSLSKAQLSLEPGIIADGSFVLIPSLNPRMGLVNGVESDPNFHMDIVSSSVSGLLGPWEGVTEELDVPFINSTFLMDYVVDCTFDDIGGWIVDSALSDPVDERSWITTGAGRLNVTISCEDSGTEAVWLILYWLDFKIEDYPILILEAEGSGNLDLSLYIWTTSHDQLLVDPSSTGVTMTPTNDELLEVNLWELLNSYADETVYKIGLKVSEESSTAGINEAKTIFIDRIQVGSVRSWSPVLAEPKADLNSVAYAENGVIVMKAVTAGPNPDDKRKTILRIDLDRTYDKYQHRILEWRCRVGYESTFSIVGYAEDASSVTLMECHSMSEGLYSVDLLEFTEIADIAAIEIVLESPEGEGKIGFSELSLILLREMYHTEYDWTSFEDGSELIPEKSPVVLTPLVEYTPPERNTASSLGNPTFTEYYGSNAPVTSLEYDSFVLYERGASYATFVPADAPLADESGGILVAGETNWVYDPSIGTYTDLVVDMNPSYSGTVVRLKAYRASLEAGPGFLVYYDSDFNAPIAVETFELQYLDDDSWVDIGLAYSHYSVGNPEHGYEATMYFDAGRPMKGQNEVAITLYASPEGLKHTIDVTNTHKKDTFQFRVIQRWTDLAYGSFTRPCVNDGDAVYAATDSWQTYNDVKIISFLDSNGYRVIEENAQDYSNLKMQPVQYERQRWVPDGTYTDMSNHTIEDGYWETYTETVWEPHPVLESWTDVDFMIRSVGGKYECQFIYENPHNFTVQAGESMTLDPATSVHSPTDQAQSGWIYRRDDGYKAFNSGAYSATCWTAGYLDPDNDGETGYEYFYRGYEQFDVTGLPDTCSINSAMFVRFMTGTSTDDDINGQANRWIVREVTQNWGSLTSSDWGIALNTNWQLGSVHGETDNSLSAGEYHHYADFVSYYVDEATDGLCHAVYDHRTSGSILKLRFSHVTDEYSSNPSSSEYNLFKRELAGARIDAYHPTGYNRIIVSYNMDSTWSKTYGADPTPPDSAWWQEAPHGLMGWDTNNWNLDGLISWTDDKITPSDLGTDPGSGDDVYGYGQFLHLPDLYKLGDGFEYSGKFWFDNYPGRSGYMYAAVLDSNEKLVVRFGIYDLWIYTSTSVADYRAYDANQAQTAVATVQPQTSSAKDYNAEEWGIRSDGTNLQYRWLTTTWSTLDSINDIGGPDRELEWLYIWFANRRYYSYSELITDIGFEDIYCSFNPPNTAPVIDNFAHDPSRTDAVSSDYHVSARVVDSNLQSVYCSYSVDNGASWQEIDVTSSGDANNNYHLYIPKTAGGQFTHGWVEATENEYNILYKFRAVDTAPLETESGEQTGGQITDDDTTDSSIDDSIGSILDSSSWWTAPDQLQLWADVSDTSGISSVTFHVGDCNSWINIPGIHHNVDGEGNGVWKSQTTTTLSLGSTLYYWITVVDGDSDDRSSDGEVTSTYNVVSNGGFETGDLSYWSTSGSSPASVTSNEAYEGTYGAKLTYYTPGADVDAYVSQSYSQPIHLDYLEFYYKYTIPYPDFNLKYTINFQSSPSLVVTIYLSQCDWTLVHQDISPDSPVTSIRIESVGASVYSGGVYVDAITTGDNTRRSVSISDDDTTAPTLSNFVDDGNVDDSKMTDYHLQVDASDSGSGIASVEFQYSLNNGGTWSGWDGYDSYSSGHYHYYIPRAEWLQALESAILWKVRATDDDNDRTGDSLTTTSSEQTGGMVSDDDTTSPSITPDNSGTVLVLPEQDAVLTGDYWDDVGIDQFTYTLRWKWVGGSTWYTTDISLQWTDDWTITLSESVYSEADVGSSIIIELILWDNDNDRTGDALSAAVGLTVDIVRHLDVLEGDQTIYSVGTYRSWLNITTDGLYSMAPIHTEEVVRFDLWIDGTSVLGGEQVLLTAGLHVVMIRVWMIGNGDWEVQIISPKEEVSPSSTMSFNVLSPAPSPALVDLEMFSLTGPAMVEEHVVVKSGTPTYPNDPIEGDFESGYTSTWTTSGYTETVTSTSYSGSQCVRILYTEVFEPGLAIDWKGTVTREIPLGMHTEGITFWLYQDGVGAGDYDSEVRITVYLSDGSTVTSDVEKIGSTWTSYHVSLPTESIVTKVKVEGTGHDGPEQGDAYLYVDFLQPDGTPNVEFGAPILSSWSLRPVTSINALLGTLLIGTIESSAILSGEIFSTKAQECYLEINMPTNPDLRVTLYMGGANITTVTQSTSIPVQLQLGVNRVILYANLDGQAVSGSISVTVKDMQSQPLPLTCYGSPTGLPAVMGVDTLIPLNLWPEYLEVTPSAGVTVEGGSLNLDLSPYIAWNMTLAGTNDYVELSNSTEMDISLSPVFVIAGVSNVTGLSAIVTATLKDETGTSRQVVSTSIALDGEGTFLDLQKMAYDSYGGSYGRYTTLSSIVVKVQEDTDLTCPVDVVLICRFLPRSFRAFSVSFVGYGTEGLESGFEVVSDLYKSSETSFHGKYSADIGPSNLATLTADCYLSHGDTLRFITDVEPKLVISMLVNGRVISLEVESNPTSGNPSTWTLDISELVTYTVAGGWTVYEFELHTIVIREARVRGLSGSSILVEDIQFSATTSGHVDAVFLEQRTLMEAYLPYWDMTLSWDWTSPGIISQDTSPLVTYAVEYDSNTYESTKDFAVVGLWATTADDNVEVTQVSYSKDAEVGLTDVYSIHPAGFVSVSRTIHRLGDSSLYGDETSASLDLGPEDLTLGLSMRNSDNSSLYTLSPLVESTARVDNGIVAWKDIDPSEEDVNSPYFSRSFESIIVDDSEACDIATDGNHLILRAEANQSLMWVEYNTPGLDLDHVAWANAWIEVYSDCRPFIEPYWNSQWQEAERVYMLEEGYISISTGWTIAP